ncbi:MAG: P-type conjugative transfer protein VirB9 [Rickettsiaceae bacterium]
MNNIAKLLVIIFTFLIIVAPINVLAVRESRPTAIDSRLRVMVYNPNDVFKFTGYYNYQACIELSKDEEVMTISMGDTTSWEIIPSGYRIFIKPKELDATTNMTLITNKRTYFFELYAEEIHDMNAPDMVFSVRFLYPDEEVDEVFSQNIANEKIADYITHPENYNFNYYISGDEDIAPIKIFDDGEFTYMQFRDINAEIPAVFSVDKNLKESSVNYRLSTDSPRMIVIERVFKKLSLRQEKKVTCIFNQSFKGSPRQIP